MVQMSTAISATDTILDRCDRLEARLGRVERAITRRGSDRLVTTGGGGAHWKNPGTRQKKLCFEGSVPRFDELLVQLNTKLKAELADAEAACLEASAAELRLGEEMAA